MIELIERPVYEVQMADVSMDFICKFYQETNAHNTILMIYDDGKYFTNIAYEEVCRYSEDEELVYFIKYLCKRKSVDCEENMYENAELIFKELPFLLYVMVKDSYNGERALFYSNYVFNLERFNKEMENIRDRLKEEGVFAYLVGVPDVEDLLEKHKHPEWKLGFLSRRMNWAEANKCVLVKYLHEFTELGYDMAKKDILQFGRREKRKSEICVGKGTIFLVGRCIVEGWENFEGESLFDILVRQIMHYKLPYMVKKMKLESIMEQDIGKNDIVILINYGVSKKVLDLDLTNSFNSYNGEKWLYTDIPIHTTKIGNELITEALIENIVQPIWHQTEEHDDRIMHKGEKQLTYEEEHDLKRYLKKIKRNVNHTNQVIGACVMTCNPFTNGHRYLIEYASRIVDYLYVFVVEEDGFYFSYEDRIKMVRRGTSHLNNVLVTPSGKFMISKDTFKEYFEKEDHPEATIDAVKDVTLFKKYIAPILGITKRFVGEETKDYITAQYNHLLKEQLTGQVEVIEVPRIESDGDVISASRVRKYLEKQNWKRIAELVPHTTLEYMMINEKEYAVEKMVPDNIIRIVEFIRNHQKVVICGMGGGQRFNVAVGFSYGYGRDGEIGIL